MDQGNSTKNQSVLNESGLSQKESFDSSMPSSLNEPVKSPNLSSEPPVVKPAGVSQTQTGGGAQDVEAVGVQTPQPRRGVPKILKIIVAIMLAAVLVLGVIYLVTKVLPDQKLFGKKGEIVWWGLWEDEQTISPLIQEYQNTNPGVKITYVRQSPADYRERLVNALEKGEGPDVFSIHNSWVGMMSNYLSTIPSKVMTQQDFSDIYYPIIVSDMTTPRGIVGIPLGYDALTLFVNNDIFKTYEKTPPETWDDFRKIAQELTIKNDTGDTMIHGTALGSTGNVDHWQEIVGFMMVQNGVDLSDPVKNQTLASDVFKFYAAFSRTDKIWDETLPPSTRYFAEGKVAMFFAPSWKAFEIIHINPNLNFRTVPLPQLAKLNPQDPDYAYATYWAESVWNKSTNQEEAWEFLKFISNRESLAKIFENATKTRLFGQAYPRKDMQDLLLDSPYLGSIVKLAPSAKSWYLASRTHDGESGINTLLGAYFADTVNAFSAKKATSDINALSQGIKQVLNKFSIK